MEQRAAQWRGCHPTQVDVPRAQNFIVVTDQD